MACSHVWAAGTNAAGNAQAWPLSEVSASVLWGPDWDCCIRGKLRLRSCERVTSTPWSTPTGDWQRREPDGGGEIPWRFHAEAVPRRSRPEAQGARGRETRKGKGVLDGVGAPGSRDETVLEIGRAASCLQTRDMIVPVRMCLEGRSRGNRPHHKK